MTQVGAALRIGAIIIVMFGVLWTVNVVRSAGRLQAELDHLKIEHQALQEKNESLLASANDKARGERALRTKFDQLKKLAVENTNACDSEPLPAAYIDQLRDAAAAATLSDDTGRMARADAGTATADNGR